MLLEAGQFSIDDPEMVEARWRSDERIGISTLNRTKRNRGQKESYAIL